MSRTCDERLERVLWFCEHFHAPVFPCKPDSKEPLVKWREAASADSTQIRKWFRRFPNANWGMPTGSASGIVVLDVDIQPEKNRRGDVSLQALAPSPNALPATVVVETPSGGRHYYFRPSRSNIPNSVDRLGRGLDVRGDGGFVVIPPSTIGGRPYRLASGGD